MPSFRGIDVSLVIHPGDKKLPEFPHSDASSVCILPPNNDIPDPRDSKSSSPVASSSKIQKVGPRISVYIPSSPGSQFGIRYSVDKVPEPPCYFYFKLFLNGRNVTNWGINPACQSSGSVTRALFEPDDRWHYKERGVVLKREGIEARCFWFLPSSSKTSIAEDGGLVEVQVFRSKGRKRVTPVLGQHRGQECYGIASPSGGLLESPEDAHYYHWLLTDPREFPFVSFRFHYRSWKNLRQLSLVPADVTFEGRDDDDAVASLDTLPPPIFQPEAGDSGPPTGSNEAMLKYDDEDLVRRLMSMLEEPRSTSTSGRLSSRAPRSLEHSSAARPLPEIPEGRLSVPRKSSESYAPSIAPSLLPYIKEESEEDEVAEFGLATQIPLRSKSNSETMLETRHTEKSQAQSQGHTCSPSSSSSWPLGDVSPAQEELSPISSIQHDTPTLTEVGDGECNRNTISAPSSCESLTRSMPRSTYQASMNEGEWMKGITFEFQETGSITNVTKLQLERVNKTRLGGFHAPPQPIDDKYSRKEKILRSLGRHGISTKSFLKMQKTTRN